MGGEVCARSKGSSAPGALVCRLRGALVDEAHVAFEVVALGEGHGAALAGKRASALVHAPHMVVHVPLEPEGGAAVRAYVRLLALVDGRDVGLEMGLHLERRGAPLALERPPLGRCRRRGGGGRGGSARGASDMAVHQEAQVHLVARGRPARRHRWPPSVSDGARDAGRRSARRCRGGVVDGGAVWKVDRRG